MTKRDIIVFIFKWEWSLFGYWFFIIGLSVLLVYSIPQRFEAIGKILIEGNRAPVMRADVVFGAEPANVLNSAVAIIRSKPVITVTARQVEARIRRASKNNDNKKEEPSAVGDFIDQVFQWMQDVGLSGANSRRDQLISDIEDNLQIVPQPNSNIIDISYKSDDPEMAAFIVNTVTKNYIDQHLKIFSSVGTSEIYGLQIARLESELDSQKKELSDYKRENSVSALKDTMRAQVQLQTKLSAELSKLEPGLAELTTRFSEGHIKVVLLKERIEVTQQSLADSEKKLQNLELEQALVRDMEIEIGSILQTLQNYKKLFEQEEMVKLANPDVVNVLIIEEAVPPTLPGHSRLFYILLATLGGLLLSFAIAFIKEYFDHRVTDPKVAAQLLGVPTLGSIEKA